MFRLVSTLLEAFAYSGGTVEFVLCPVLGWGIFCFLRLICFDNDNYYNERKGKSYD